MNIEVGDILNINVENNKTLGEHRKTKYGVVVISVKEDGGFNFFCINTENRARYECIPIRKETYKFLKNDIHYISCSDMFVAKLEQINSKNNAQLTAEDRKMLLNKVKNSIKLPPKYKKEIFNAFNVEFDNFV